VCKGNLYSFKENTLLRSREGKLIILRDKYYRNGLIRSESSIYWESPYSRVGMAQYIEFSLLIGNPNMGNTKYGNGYVTIFSDQIAIKNQHQLLIFSPSWLSQSILSHTLISELILAYWPLLPPLRWVLIFFLLLLFLNSFNSSVFFSFFIYTQ
jgi:hypothetical protein